jgi:hypothetical protein
VFQIKEDELAERVARMGEIKMHKNFGQET